MQYRSKKAWFFLALLLWAVAVIFWMTWILQAPDCPSNYISCGSVKELCSKLGCSLDQCTNALVCLSIPGSNSLYPIVATGAWFLGLISAALAGVFESRSTTPDEVMPLLYDP